MRAARNARLDPRARSARRLRALFPRLQPNPARPPAPRGKSRRAAAGEWFRRCRRRSSIPAQAAKDRRRGSSRPRPEDRPRHARPCVALTPPERFAEGATSGAPAASISARATGCAGTRSASVSSPARASRLMRQFAETGATIVSGAGPKGRREFLRACVEPRLARGRSRVGEMCDQRIERGPPLRRVDRRDGGVRGREPREPVDRLRRHRDQPARAQTCGGGGDVFRSRRRDARFAGRKRFHVSAPRAREGGWPNLLENAREKAVWSE